MAENPLTEARRILDQAAPKASKIFLADYVGNQDLPFPEWVLASLRKLPVTGRIKRKKDIMTVKAVSWLVGVIAEPDPNKSEIMELFREALNRTYL